ncbi:hypothetical protein ACFE04_020226 [Oxalis oulophora]
MNTREEIAYDFFLALVAIFLIIFVAVLYIMCRKKPVTSHENLSIKTNVVEYPLVDIYAATDGFNHRRIIGQGRLGTVYAAVIPTRGELVALKRIHPRLVLNNAGFGFSSILKTLSLAQHTNINPIFGYSQAPGERIIVMEAQGMGNLDFYLHENYNGNSLLDWNKRLRIASGVARGLKYLHEEMAPNVIHGSLKPSNILIDVNYCARLCDYGLHFLTPKEKKGLVGYVDDEYWSGGCCKESDIYGFGMVLLEILSGRRCEEGLLVNWGLPLIKEMRFDEFLDPSVVIPNDINPLIRLAKVASACVANSRKHRPSITQVETILSSLELELELRFCID